MGQNYPNKSMRVIGAGDATRRAVSYTPAAAMTIKHWAFIGIRTMNPNYMYAALAGTTLNEVNEITWEIRADAGSGNKPGTSSASLLATGTFDFRYTSEWGFSHAIKKTVTLSSPLALEAGTRYWFILKNAGDEDSTLFPLAWIDTYDTGAAGEVDSAVYSAEYNVQTGLWGAGDNTYNLTLYILDKDAGVKWHVVLNDQGYMQPDELRGYRCEQVASGVAQSRGGQSEYSQLRYPYSNMSQDAWTSGMSQLLMDDPAAFLYNLATDTTLPHQVILGPQIHLTGVYAENPRYESDTVVVRGLPDLEKGSAAHAANYVAQMITTLAGGNTLDHVGVRIAKNNWAFRHKVYIAIFNSVTGSPGSTNITGWVEMSPGYKWEWVDVAVTGVLAPNTDYWIVVKSDQAWGFLPEYKLIYDQTGAAAGGPAKYSVNDGTSWSVLTGYSLCVRVNYGPDGAMEDNCVAIKYGSVGGTAGLFAVGGKGVYKFNTSTGYWESIATNIEATGSSLLTADGVDAIVFDDKLLVSQGYDYPIRVWNGTEWKTANTTELILNGGFTTDTTSWVAANATLASVASGQSGNCLQITNVGTNYGQAKQNITVTSGRWYEVSVYHKNGTTTGELKIGSTDGGAELHDSAAYNDANWTQHKVLVKATSTVLSITLWCATNTDGQTTLFDTVTVTEGPVGKWFHIGRGFLWRSSAVNTVSRTNNLTTWSADITVGEAMWEINAFANYAGKMLVGKEDGIWEIDAQDLALEYLIFREHADPDNCKGMTVWNDMLFIPVMHSIWRWQGSQYRLVGPTDTDTGPTDSLPEKITRMTATPDLLWAAAEPGELMNTGTGGLLVYNGTGWHCLVEATRSGLASRAICVTTEVGTNEVRIWWGEGSRVTYVKYPNWTSNRYDWNSADYTITPGNLITSWWDGGLKDAVKFWHRVTLIADIPSETSIEVWAARDGEDWNEPSEILFLGECTPALQTDTGEYVVMFPDGMVAKTVQLIFVFNTFDSTKTPRLKAYNIESLVRQVPVYGYTFVLLLAENITKMDKTTESTRGPDTMWEELQRAARRDDPIVVSFPNKTIRGVITSLREDSYGLQPSGMEAEVWERRAHVTVVEA